jgi:hypothetical protein
MQRYDGNHTADPSTMKTYIDLGKQQTSSRRSKAIKSFGISCIATNNISGVGNFKASIPRQPDIYIMRYDQNRK